MIPIPVKAMPYLLIIGGIGGILSGDAALLGVVMAAVGGAWLYYKHRTERQPT